MRLYLLRHAEAEAEAPEDALRELTEMGWAQAQAVADWLQTQVAGRATLLASPLLRAQQTASVVRQALNLDAPETVDALVPEGDILQAEQAISRALHGGCDELIVVSHMPLLPSLASWLEEGVLSMGASFALAEVRVYEAEIVAPGVMQAAGGFQPEETTRALSELMSLISRF